MQLKLYRIASPVFSKYDFYDDLFVFKIAR